MVPIKPAATVLCVRENPELGSEILLLRRNTELKFASGFWVFPGGKVEESDRKSADLEQAAITAAKREAKEESGLDLSDNELFYYCNWTTPVPSPKRFHTWFFVTKVPFEKSQIVIDDSEIKDYKWITPNQAIEQLHKEQIKLMPPTFLSVVRIRQASNYNEILNEYARSAPLIAKPRTGMIGEVFQSMYKGDAGYEDHDVHKPGPRHRITGSFAVGKYDFEYHGCDDVFPVHGGYTW